MICIPKWKLELEKHWETIQQVLKTKKVSTTVILSKSFIFAF